MTRHQRELLEKVLWENTPPDYRSTRSDGTRVVNHMEQGVTYGTESWPISKFTDEQLIAKLPAKLRPLSIVGKR